MDNCKYIVADTPQGGNAMFLFPPFITHVQFARALHLTDDVVSAGFVGVDCHGKLYVYGESETLKKKSDAGDVVYLKRMFPEE